MTAMLLLLLWSLAVLPLARPMPASPPFQLNFHSLTTEYLTDPLGVDVKNPRLSWKLNATNGDRGIYQTSYQITVSSFDVAAKTTVSWTTCPNVTSSRTYLVPLLGQEESPCPGLELQSDTQYEWHVSVTVQQIMENGLAHTFLSPTATFRTGLLDDPDWKAEWITGGNDKTMLRASFQTPEDIQSHATLFISGVGYYEAYLDGNKIGDHVLDVGWTDYRKRVWYATHDVTELLQTQSKEHVLGVMLGNGWWSCGPPPGSNQPQCGNDPPQVKLQLQVDGKLVLISQADDDQWQALASPILYNSLYNGETYDARVAEAQKGWSSNVDFKAKDSSPVRLANSIVNQAKLSSQLFEPIRHISTLSPVSISVISPQDGKSLTQIIDFGQNAAAVTSLKKIHCPRGTNVTLRHAEVLMHPPYGPKNGSIYVDNLRSAKATDVYICSGNSQGESYTPTFTQHGFRYLKVTGLDYELTVDDIEAVVLHTDIQQASSLDFSDPLLNQIQHICFWGQKTNFMSVPTDCPNRDERRGWMGDAALSSEIAAYNFNVAAVYSSWLFQVVDAQAADGSVPNYVPALDALGHPGAPNWQTAFPTLIWTLHKYYGDVQVASQHHEALVRYYDFLQTEYQKSGIKSFRGGFGDWCPPPPQPRSNRHLMGAFALIHDLRLGVKIFSASTHRNASDQATRCRDLVKQILGEYHEAFFNAQTGVYGTGLQTEQALSLFADAVPAGYKDQVVEGFVNDIQVANSNHTTSGIVGIKFGMEILSALGHSDVALELARQKTYPSWGYMVNHADEPATTLWELWDAPVKGPSMNSRNHIMFGSVSSWFFKYLAGIQPVEAGYKQIAIQPSGQSTLEHASAKVGTPHGDILSSWKMNRATASYIHHLSIPLGTNATFLVPFEVFDKKKVVTITEGGSTVWTEGRFLAATPGVVSGVQVEKGIQFQLLNGRYEFGATAPTQAKSTSPQTKVKAELV